MRRNFLGRRYGEFTRQYSIYKCPGARNTVLVRRTERKPVQREGYSLLEKKKIRYGEIIQGLRTHVKEFYLYPKEALRKF